LIYLQLSERFEDLKERFMQVEIVRRKVKEHLNDDAFFGPKLGEEGVYKVPPLCRMCRRRKHSSRLDLHLLLYSYYRMSAMTSMILSQLRSWSS
jgi:hypothetical protein